MNGVGLQSFLEGYQRTMAQLDERHRREQEMQMRQTQMTQQTQRQSEMDRIAGEERNRQHTIQNLGVGESLGQIGGQQETPQGAEHAIDALYQMLTPSLGSPEQLSGLRDTAIAQATQTITARQKRQVSEYVDKSLKTSFVADNPDADPVIENLPEHVARAIGKPSARLSELQQFAQLPVGKPQGKERMPAAAGSFEDFSTATPERKAQILADRKAYQQADDRPRVDVNVNGGLNPNQSALLTEKLAKNWQDVTAPSREMNRQFGLMETGLQRFRAGDKNGGSQAVLVTFQKILDPTSVVRESEYARSADGVSMLARIQGYADKLAKGGAGVPDAELAQMVETARQMKDQTQSYASSMRSRIEAVAAKNKIDPVTVFGIEPQASMVKLQAPDGTIKEVPAADADHFIKLGAKVVK